MGLRRRALLAAVLAGGVAATQLSPVGQLLDQFGPLNGSVWDAATASRPETVRSPYGSATVRYANGVPTIAADSEEGLAYAVGYVHGSDRRFQMDLFARRMRGELAAAVGQPGVDSDIFHTQMDFEGAAQANWDLLRDTEAGPAISAYADGVRSATADRPLPVEFQLLEYEPLEWTPVGTLLIQKQIAWGLTGSFRTLRTAAAAEALGSDLAASLYPGRLDHDSPILRGTASFADQSSSDQSADGGIDAAFARWLTKFESPQGVGSNSWVVSGEQTASGQPLVANDPHLPLMAPPVWYRQHLSAPALSVGGVTFPGVPFVIIGENDAGAWGFTNAGADGIDFYTYETEGDQYRYGDEWRTFDRETETVTVADGENREVTVRKSVHGPVIERFGQQVGVAWVGLQANRTPAAVRDLNYSDGREEAMDALRRFDHPTQNAVYADQDGHTQYYMTGLVPRRMTDGEAVPGDRVFDGSAREGEWPGYEPYGTPNFDAFVASEEKPQSRDPDYVATANQRIVDDDTLDFYIAESYADPFRGQRIYGLLDERAASNDPIDMDFMQQVQRDVRDERAALFVPHILDARTDMTDRARAAATELGDWNYRMTRESRPALLFTFFLKAYRARLFDPAFAAADLDDRFYPSDWVLLTLDPESRWFTDPPVGDSRTRAATIAAALDDAVSNVEDSAYAVYGDYNRTAIDHPFDQSFLNYPRYPTDGSPATVRNMRVETGVGSSYRLLARLDDNPSEAAIPGGNVGNPFDDQYDDTLQAWADGRYHEQTLTTDGDPGIRFKEGAGNE